MRYRKDAKSGRDLSVLGMGCLRFPKVFGVIDMPKTRKLILDAVAGGVNYFDTAYIYPGSEEALGAALQSGGVREKVCIATKMPLVLLKGPADFDRFFEKSLQRLRTGYVDYYLMHMLTDLAAWQKLVSWGIEEWLAERRAAGQIRQIGFSFHGSQGEFLKLLEARDWDFCQIQYNYSDENFQAGVTGLRRAAEKGLPVIIMEPLLGGRLAGGLPAAAEKRFREARPGWTAAAWALNWLFDQREVAVVLSGMASEADLRENLSVADAAEPGMLTPSDRQALAAALAAIRAAVRIRCTGCGYCMPCPRNVNISACFSAYNTYFAHGFFAGFQQYTTSTGALSDHPSRAGRCVKCGLCEKHCPQNLPIRANLDLVRKRLEPWWYLAGLTAARRFLAAGRPAAAGTGEPAASRRRHNPCACFAKGAGRPAGGQRPPA